MALILKNDENNLGQWPPLRLAKVARLGAILVATEFVWTALAVALVRLQALYFGPYLGILAIAASIVLYFAPIVIGGVTVGLALWRLAAGVTRIKWNQAEIESARLWAESRDLSRTAKWLLLSFVLVDLFASWRSHTTTVGLLFDSLALVGAPPLVISAILDRLRQAPFTPPHNTRDED